MRTDPVPPFGIGSCAGGPPKRSWSWGPPKEWSPVPSWASRRQGTWLELAARFENAVAVAMTVPIPATWDPERKP